MAGLERSRRGAGDGQDRRRTGTIAWHEARARAFQLADALPIEQIALTAAAGRTLTAPVVAAIAVPGFDNAAMDGYAVRGCAPWRVSGRILAGQPATAPLCDGQAVEIATGAPIPHGAERVVPYEVARQIDGLVDAPADERTHIRRAGEYVAAGEEVLAADAVLRPAALGFAASVGIDSVAVRRRARARILVTGDEIVACGVPAHGEVRDAIGPTIATLLPDWGAEVEAVRIVRDSREELSHAVVAAASTVDVIVVCGSSSVGRADHLHGLLHDLDARIEIDGVACRPGHPQLLARLGATWIVGLPGNPYAALVAACTIVQPLLAGLGGRALPQLARARLDGVVPADEHHTRLVPARWAGHRACVIDGARPGYLGAAAQADALAVVTPASRPGAAFELVPLPGG
jgi:molybdopterin molybdotransferase